MRWYARSRVFSVTCTQYFKKLSQVNFLQPKRLQGSNRTENVMKAGFGIFVLPQNPRMAEAGTALWPTLLQEGHLSRAQDPGRRRQGLWCFSTTQHSSAACCSEGGPVLQSVPVASCPGIGHH